MSRKVINIPAVGVGIPIRYAFKVPMRIWSIAFGHTNGEATAQTAYVQIQDSEGGGRLLDVIDNVATPALSSKIISFGAESVNVTNASNMRSSNGLPDLIVNTGNTIEINADSIVSSTFSSVKMVVEDMWEAGDDEEDDDDE